MPLLVVISCFFFPWQWCRSEADGSEEDKPGDKSSTSPGTQKCLFELNHVFYVRVESCAFFSKLFTFTLCQGALLRTCVNFSYIADKNSGVSSQVESEDLDKKSCPEDRNEESSLENQESGTSNRPVVIESSLSTTTTVVQQMGFIPSLGVYSDSSDSESSSSDSDILPSLFTNFTSTAK